ncbi:hypothetical protein CEXT_482321 [Caerostris extrusa]|uniref:Uncharacterized protein n=1 Tax=Caerostris extrusa TaxID=172846 RepID=A0AAV4P0Z0_CAEEX|nr:hypothetical protein CEXT_482321 [Caerostris extrusa]
MSGVARATPPNTQEPGSDAMQHDWPGKDTKPRPGNFLPPHLLKIKNIIQNTIQYKKQFLGYKEGKDTSLYLHLIYVKKTSVIIDSRSKIYITVTQQKEGNVDPQDEIERLVPLRFPDYFPVAARHLPINQVYIMIILERNTRRTI